MTLRDKLIRLAHAKPELRKHLLPILKEANSGGYLVEVNVGLWDYTDDTRGDWTDFLSYKKQYSNIPDALKDIEEKIDKAYENADEDREMAEARWKYRGGIFTFIDEEDVEIGDGNYVQGLATAYEHEGRIDIRDENKKPIDTDLAKRILKALNSRSPVWKQFK